MDAKLQRRVQRYGWDAAAGAYDAGWGDGLRAVHDTSLQMAGLAPGMRVIETACGTGLVTRRIAAEVQPNGAVLATDISGEMVETTARSIQHAGYEHVRAARMEAENLEVEDRTYDVALCALGLMYVPQPTAALAEMRRVVRVSGKVVVTVWGERKHCGWADIFPVVDAVVHSEVCPLFFALGAPGALARSMSQVGLERIEEVRRDVEMRWSDAGALLAAVIDGGAVALAAKRFSPEVRNEVETNFLASVADFRRSDGSYVIPGEFVTVVGSVS